ncbi:MAG: NUDIX domain-containing protein [Gammaproteobacteria bacterium]|nr:NUDIX domain-containing protein [Gammaproteobacteria bacterium]
MQTREIGGKPRRACPSCGFVHFVEPKVGVGAWVEDEAQRVLLVKRGFQPEKGKWSLPAGYLDRGDDPIAHAQLEVLEETGLEVRVQALIDVIRNPPEQGGASIFILYRAHVVAGELQAGDDAVAARFFALHELPELAFESTRRVIEHIRSRESR